jgi:hypothetical protein
VPANWPQLIIEAGFVTTSPVQPGGTFLLDDPSNGILGTNTLGADTTWSDITQWVRSGSVIRQASRQQGPLYDYQVAQATMIIKNGDGRFDPDNTSGPYTAAGVSQVGPMVPVRIRAIWNGITYPLFFGYADAWTDSGRNYAGNYAELTLTASDAQKVLAGISLPATAAAGAGELSGARVNRILNAAGWYTGTAYRLTGAGSSTVQAYTGGDSAWNLLKLTADTELGELWVNSAGQVVFRGRQQVLTDPGSSTVQLTLGDNPDVDYPGNPSEEPFTSAPPVLDDTTIANDIQVTRAGGSLQQVQNAASISQYLFPRSYSRTDLILNSDAEALSWAQWVLYTSAYPENRLDSAVLTPLRDPADLWPSVLGRHMGDRIQLLRRPPGVSAPSPITENCFIRGVSHDWNWAAGTWTTTWTLQDATQYGGFLVLDNPILGQLNSNALAFLAREPACLRTRLTPPPAFPRRCRRPRSGAGRTSAARTSARTSRGPASGCCSAGTTPVPRCRPSSRTSWT